MRQAEAPRVSTVELHRLMVSGGPLWLVFVPDRAAFTDGHIPGSLSATDEQLLAALPTGASVVLYGEHQGVEHARTLAAELAATGRDVRWYAGGLRAWSAAGLPVER